MTTTERRLCAAGALLLVGAAAIALLLQHRLLSQARLRIVELRQQLEELTPLKEQALKEEVERLQGTWEFVAMEVDGVDKAADFKDLTARFQGDQWTVSAGAEVKAQTTLKLDPTKRPKTVDIVPAPGKGALIRGIYALESDQLTICDRDVNHGDRPAEFATDPDTGLVLVVLKRVKR